MAKCDERRGLAALFLMNSGMEADDASNKTFVAVMCPINWLLGHLPLGVDNWSPSEPTCTFHKTAVFKKNHFSAIEAQC
jgi:hypothetical protein